LKILIAGLVLVIVAVSAAFVACDDGEDNGDAGANGDVADQLAQIIDDHEELHAALAKVQLVAALDALDGAGIHEFDEQTTQAATLDDLPAGYSAAVEKVHTVVSSVTWPEDTHDAVQEITTQAEALMTALEGDDLAAVKEASPQFHAAWHELREVGYAALGGDVPGHADHTGDSEPSDDAGTMEPAE
jgi:hypothetical protein